MLPHSNGIVFEGSGQGMSPPIARYFGVRRALTGSPAASSFGNGCNACARWSLPLVVSHAVLITCRRPYTHSSFPTPVYHMDTIKRFYKKARGKAKDPPRLPSHQSALTTPARSPRSTSQEPAATDGKVIYTNHSAMVFASQAAIAPTANATPTAVIPALETGPSPRLEDAAGSGATYSQPNVKPQGEGRQAVEAEELKKPEKAIATG